MANELKLSGPAWDTLSTDDKERVLRIVRATGLAKGSVSIPSSETKSEASLLEFPNFCKIGCDLGEAAAVAACGSLSGPAAAVCIAAAHAAADVCRSKC